MGYYLALKRNDVMISATLWMNLANSMLGKVNSKRQILHESTYSEQTNSKRQNVEIIRDWGLW